MSKRKMKVKKSVFGKDWFGWCWAYSKTGSLSSGSFAAQEVRPKIPWGHSQGGKWVKSKVVWRNGKAVYVKV